MSNASHVAGRGGSVTARLATKEGLGCAQLGNLYRAITDDKASAIVDAAWDSGIRYFDVAPHYGLGLAERRLGAALRGRPRDEYVISTKVGRVLVDNLTYAGERDDDLFEVQATHRRVRDFSRDGVLRSLEDSLLRLGLDRVDILYVHDPDDSILEAIDGAFPALDELQHEGVIDGYGAGMNQSAALARFIRETDSTDMMLAGRYTLLDQSAADDLLPLARERGVGIVAAGVFNSGILAGGGAGGLDNTARYNYGDAPPEIADRAARIARVCGEFGVPVHRAAANFPFTSAAVSAVVLGADTPGQVIDNAAVLTSPVPTELWDALEAEGLLRRDGQGQK